MLRHEFITLDRKEIPKEIEYSLIKKYKMVRLSDEIVCNNKLFLSGFNCYWVTIGDLHEGLNYHGISIIPNEEIPSFFTCIKGISSHNRQLEKLFNLCVEAQAKDFDIIHFGV